MIKADIQTCLHSAEKPVRYVIKTGMT